MELTIAEQIMYSTLQIEMLDAKRNTIGAASGFLYNFSKGNEENFMLHALVTNRHVLERCAFIKVFFTSAKENGDPDNENIVTVVMDTSNTIFHPDSKIDLAILPLFPALSAITQTKNRVFYRTISGDLIPSAEVWKSLDAVEDVLMVGYPQGLRDTANNLPIFRRGITATHPAFNYLGSPSFMIDIACFPGSSGSPVFILNEKGYHDKMNNRIQLGAIRLLFLGIQYAAPIFDKCGEIIRIQSTETKIVSKTQLTLNLGIVVKSTELLAFEPILKSKFGL